MNDRDIRDRTCANGSGAGSHGSPPAQVMRETLGVAPLLMPAAVNEPPSHRARAAMIAYGSSASTIHGNGPRCRRNSCGGAPTTTAGPLNLLPRHCRHYARIGHVGRPRATPKLFAKRRTVFEPSSADLSARSAFHLEGQEPVPEFLDRQCTVG